MPRTSGKLGQVWADTTTPTVADLVLGVTSWELDLKGETQDATGMDNTGGAKDFIATLTEGTGSVECFADSGLDLADIGIVQGGTIIVSLLYAAGLADCWYGTGIVTGKKPTVEISGAVKWSIGFQFTGTIAYGVIPT